MTVAVKLSLGPRSEAKLYGNNELGAIKQMKRTGAARIAGHHRLISHCLLAPRAATTLKRYHADFSAL